MSGELLAVAQALAVDRLASEVVTAWRAEGIDPILLKGASVAAWLYPEGVRPYGDADLIVDPARVWDAAAVLARLGFEPLEHHVSLHAHPWMRPDGATIDLHVRLYGLHAEPEQVWNELQRSTETISLASVRVRGLNLAARALHVTLHAVQHEHEFKPREDLRRALAATPEKAWRDAERLADRVGGLPTMAAGLRLEPDGRELSERLPFVRAALVADAGQAPLAIGVARFAAADSGAERLRVAATSLWPPDAQLRREAAAEGRRGSVPRLRAAHLLKLITQLPPTLRELRRERAERAAP